MTSIHLIGPGGAGKSTVGPILAHLLVRPFLDLDRWFAERHVDIDRFIAKYGHRGRARANLEVHTAVVRGRCDAVVALSFGFMTYFSDIHPDYAELRDRIASGDLTFVLLPSCDREQGVAETVRRQGERSIRKRTAEIASSVHES